MKTILFKKVVKDFNEVKQLSHSIDQMLDHVPVEIDGHRQWDHGCRASYNLGHDGWEVVVMSDNIRTKGKRKVHLSVHKAEPEFHLPYNRLQLKVESSQNNSNVLKIK